MLAGLAGLLPRQRHGHLFVQPATLLRWHRDLVAKRWTYSHGRPGRHPIAQGTTTLMLRFAKENPTWGYRRIRRELATMGAVIAPFERLGGADLGGAPQRAGQRVDGVRLATSRQCSSAGSTSSCSSITTRVACESPA